MTLDAEDIAAIADAVAIRITKSLVNNLLESTQPLTAADLTDRKAHEMSLEDSKKFHKALRQAEKRGK